MEQSRASKNPEILIVGAGIAGLMMALLLEQIGFPYHVFERAGVMKPLGSGMAFDANTLTALEQLGLYEDLLKVSKAFDSLYFYKGEGKSLGVMDRSKNEEKFGYKVLVFSRPDFYDILLKRVPTARISYKKKILRTEEKDNRVIIHCSDNTSYSGDILIGCDGAYSGVRQSMYKQMSQIGLLPKADLEDFSIGYTVVVGIAKGDPEKYPVLKDDLSKFSQIVYDGDSNCYVITLPNNQISWGFGTQVSRETMKEMHYRSSEWSADTSETTLKQFRDFPSPIGGTMGEIFDATPKEYISKIYLEEKIFKTWHHGRIVLIGDACHKYHPAAGQGAGNAIYDAIVLANCLYGMDDTSEKSIHAAFNDYFEQRYIHAKTSFDNSIGFAKILNGQKRGEKLLRKIFLNYIPAWAIDASVAKVVKYRPQVAWLPLAEHRGKGKILPQGFEKVNRSGSSSASISTK
ncbi:hypothetical protein BGZ76_004725 [Entomortierella beljakovae]|nr:hypothetical protein BGZ76_004725 [Entomortierella beljakovae]